MARRLFADQSVSAYRLLLALVVGVVLVVLDTRSGFLAPVRQAMALATEPVVVAADLPRRTFNWLDEAFTLRSTLQEENASLRNENLVLKRHVQRVAALTAENARLRELLNSSALLDSSVVVAEITGFDPDPSRRELIIDKGSDAGITAGQPVLDASGIMGQVMLVGSNQSRVILVTDTRHGIPVEVARNGVRTIATGAGVSGVLNLQYLPVTADIREGDLLVSSGLGGRFPQGYPVARVTTVSRDPGETFAQVEAQPAAAIEQSRHVLLVFTQGAGLQGALMQKATAPVADAPASPAAAPAAAPPATPAPASGGTP